MSNSEKTALAKKYIFFTSKFENISSENITHVVFKNHNKLLRTIGSQQSMSLPCELSSNCIISRVAYGKKFDA